MVDLVIALALMVAVVGPLLFWLARKDMRRRLEAAPLQRAGEEEVA